MQLVNEYATWYVQHLTLLSMLVGIVAFVLSCLIDKQADGFSSDLISRSATWCSLPYGFAFLICFADASYTAKLPDTGLAFFMGGIAIIYVVLCDIKSIWRRSAPSNNQLPAQR